MAAVKGFRAMSFVVFVVFLGCGAVSPQYLPGKIAYEAGVFPYTGDFRSNYGVCVFRGEIVLLHQKCRKARWSPDGTQLLYWASTNEGEWVVETYPAGKAVRRFSTPHLVDQAVVWASEQVLYYVAYYWEKGLKEETPKNLYRYHLDTGQEEQLTSFTEAGSGTDITSFTISPDEKTIVFAKDDRDETKAPGDPFGGKSTFLFRLDLPTGQVTRLFKGDYPRFMPDGRRIICARWELHGGHRGSSDLYFYDFGTQQFTQITNNGEGMQERESCPSPDGQYIVFKMAVFGGGEKGRALYVINADGTNEHLLVGHDGNDYGDPDWGP